MLCSGFGGSTSTAPAFGATTGSAGFGAGGGFGAGLGSAPSLFGQPSASTTSSAFGFKPAASTTFGSQCNTGGLFALQCTYGHAHTSTILITVFWVNLRLPVASCFTRVGSGV